MFPDDASHNHGRFSILYSSNLYASNLQSAWKKNTSWDELEYFLQEQTNLDMTVTVVIVFLSFVSQNVFFRTRKTAFLSDGFVFFAEP